VASPIDDQLRDQFYRWELRGRGWLLWDYPVLPKPPFGPFPGFAIAPFEEDDGRQQTLVSGPLDWLHRWLRGKLGKPEPVQEQAEPSPDYWEFEQPTHHPGVIASSLVDHLLSCIGPESPDKTGRFLFAPTGRGTRQSMLSQLFQNVNDPKAHPIRRRSIDAVGEPLGRLDAAIESLCVLRGLD
jgi:hypothetical protein